MHRSAEYGIAADFRFPQHGRPRLGTAAPAPSSWTGCAGCSTGSRTPADPAQFLESLRCDLAEAQIQVFADGRHGAAAGRRDAGRPRVRAGHRARRPSASARDGSTAGWPRSSSPLADGDVVEIFTETDARRTASTPTPPRAAPPGVAGLRQVAARPDADQPAGSPSTPSPASRIADKVRLGRAAIGLALRKHDRGLASDLPLLRLADGAGLPRPGDAAGRGRRPRPIEPDDVVDAADRPGRPPAVTDPARAVRALRGR